MDPLTSAVKYVKSINNALSNADDLSCQERTIFTVIKSTLCFQMT